MKRQIFTIIIAFILPYAALADYGGGSIPSVTLDMINGTNTQGIVKTNLNNIFTGVNTFTDSTNNGGTSSGVTNIGGVYSGGTFNITNPVVNGGAITGATNTDSVNTRGTFTGGAFSGTTNTGGLYTNPTNTGIFVNGFLTLGYTNSGISWGTNHTITNITAWLAVTNTVTGFVYKIPLFQ